MQSFMGYFVLIVLNIWIQQELWSRNSSPLTLMGAGCQAKLPLPWSLISGQETNCSAQEKVGVWRDSPLINRQNSASSLITVSELWLAPPCLCQHPGSRTTGMQQSKEDVVEEKEVPIILPTIWICWPRVFSVMFHRPRAPVDISV